MARKLNQLPPSLGALKDYHYIEDDFHRDIDAAEWVATTGSGDGGSASVGDEVGGVLTLLTNVTNNTEEYVESPNETFKFAANKPLTFRTRLQFAEAATDDANVIAGVLDAVGADTLVDDGAGPKASYSGAVFFKQDGQTLWSVEASIAGAQTTAQLSAANSLDKKDHVAGSSAYQWLEIDFRPISATLAEIVFSIDGVDVYKMVGDFITNATEMQIGLGVKAGGANQEALKVDYVSCIQAR